MFKIYISIAIRMLYGVFLVIAGLYTAWVIYGGIIIGR